MFSHELDDVTQTKAGGGVLARAEGRAGPDLEARNALKVLGKEAGVAADNKVVADPKMKRGGFALVEFANAAFQAGLEFSQGQDFRGVDLQDSGLAGAFELGAGQRKLGSCQLASLKNVHRCRLGATGWRLQEFVNVNVNENESLCLRGTN